MSPPFTPRQSTLWSLATLAGLIFFTLTATWHPHIAYVALMTAATCAAMAWATRATKEHA